MQQEISNEYPWQPQVMNNGDEEATIDLLEVCYLFWGHLRQVIVWLLIGMTVGLLYTWKTGLGHKPQYQATAQVYVESAENDITDILMILSNLPDDMSSSDVANAIKSWQRLPSDESIIEDYKALLLCRPLLQDVIGRLSLDMSTAALEKMITIKCQESSHIIEIAVTGPDPQKAANIANELVSQGEIYFRNFVGTEPPRLLGRAEAPTNELVTGDSRYVKNVALGGVLSALLYCIFLLVRFLLNDTIVTPDNVMECFGVVPLATIPKANSEVFSAENDWQERERRNYNE